MIALVDEVDVPDRPAVPGVTFRRFRGAAVDGLNPNQAMTLYSSLGFEISSMSIDWTKPLPAWTGVPAPSEAP